MEERKKGPLHIGETMERRQGGKGYGMGGGGASLQWRPLRFEEEVDNWIPVN